MNVFFYVKVFSIPDHLSFLTHTNLQFTFTLLVKGYKVKVFSFKLNYRVSIIKLAFLSNTNIKDHVEVEILISSCCAILFTYPEYPTPY